MKVHFRSYLLITTFLIGWQAPLCAQRIILRGIVQDIHSEEPIPFASIRFTSTSIGKLSDSSGQFIFTLTRWPSDTLEVTCVGYQPRLLALTKKADSSKLIITLERRTFTEAATVRYKINKGLFVWRKIVQHKPQNDRFLFSNYAYELHNKLEIDLKNIDFKKLGAFKPIRPITQIIQENQDSSDGTRYLPAYMTEVISQYYFQKDPKRRREIIQAANTNGVSNPSVIKLLGGMDQVVNVYNNFITVLDRKFVSPASDNGDYYYNYRVADTQYIAGKPFFHLVFTPRRKGADTFEGDCWVQAGSFAIQKMNLRLNKESQLNFIEHISLIQEFSPINDSTWFLKKDKFVADVSPMGSNRPGFIGRKTTTYRNITVNDSLITLELNKNKLNEEVITLEGATEKDTAYWNERRHEPLNKNEQGILHMIDTLNQIPTFKKFTKTVGFIGSGNLDAGNYTIGPWMNWISSNSWEGLRLRFDLATNKHFNRKIRFHGYLAYGFGDQKLKGMGEVFYLPAKDPRFYLYASYANDLDWGQNYYGEISQDNIFALAMRKQGIAVKNIKLNEKKLEVFRENFPWMSNRLTISYNHRLPLRNLPPIDSFPTYGSGDPLTSFEVSLRFRFAYLERFVENQFYRSSLGSSYPIAEFTITKGFAGVFRSSYSFTSLTASLSDDMKIPPLGQIAWSIYGGRTIGTLPYTLLNIAPGNELHYYNKYAFNMMNRWEFIHDRFAGGQFEHNIGSGLFKWTPKWKLRQFWNVKALFGSLSEENKKLNFITGNSFQSLNGKTYLELGTGIDNILKVFRLDLVWRVLPSTLPKNGDKTFGVFGSFRLGF